MLTVKRIFAGDELGSVIRDINGAAWDEANEMVAFDTESLTHYLQQPATVFVVCYKYDGEKQTFLGMSSARIELKPYDQETWLYIDEVDVAVNQRQQGAGKAMMSALLDIAKQADCDEVWLGTELDNDAANALYRAMKPSETEQFVGYTWTFNSE